MGAVRLVTWNVKSLRARLPRLLELLDKHRPDVGLPPGDQDRARRLLDAGLVDAYRRLHPDEVGYTWWDYRAGHFHRRMGLRIDFALLSPDLAERLTSCGIDRAFRKGPRPSDHAPLVVELRG